MKEFLVEHLSDVVVAVFTAVVTYIIRGQNKKIKEQQSIKDGVQALLRDRLIQSYNHYMKQRYCPIYARESMSEMAKQYYNLGGNGIIPSLMERIMSLPTEEQLYSRLPLEDGEGQNDFIE